MFIRDKTYKRQEISAQLGGGIQDYLPHMDGRVTYGAFSKELNPRAPTIILPGRGPEIERWARVLAEQTDAIPVFTKRRANEWTFRGHYRCVRLSEDPNEIELHECATGRTDISMVLHLERDKAFD